MRFVTQLKVLRALAAAGCFEVWELEKLTKLHPAQIELALGLLNEEGLVKITAPGTYSATPEAQALLRGR